MDKKAISKDRKIYLRKQKINKIAVLFVQIAIIVGFIAIWEIFANIGICLLYTSPSPRDP